jgi:hypothetical protein
MRTKWRFVIDGDQVRLRDRPSLTTFAIAAGRRYRTLGATQLFDR